MYRVLEGLTGIRGAFGCRESLVRLVNRWQALGTGLVHGESDRMVGEERGSV